MNDCSSRGRLLLSMSSLVTIHVIGGTEETEELAIDDFVSRESITMVTGPCHKMRRLRTALKSCSPRLLMKQTSSLQIAHLQTNRPSAYLKSNVQSNVCTLNLFGLVGCPHLIKECRIHGSRSLCSLRVYKEDRLAHAIEWHTIARWKSGLLPFVVFAIRVNWDTHRISPSTSFTLAFHILSLPSNIFILRLFHEVNVRTYDLVCSRLRTFSWWSRRYQLRSHLYWPTHQLILISGWDGTE